MAKDITDTEGKREKARDIKDEETRNNLRDFTTARIRENNNSLINEYFDKERGIVLQTEMKGIKGDIKDIKRMVSTIFEKMDKIK